MTVSSNPEAVARRLPSDVRTFALGALDPLRVQGGKAAYSLRWIT